MIHINTMSVANEDTERYGQELHSRFINRCTVCGRNVTSRSVCCDNGVQRNDGKALHVSPICKKCCNHS